MHDRESGPLGDVVIEGRSCVATVIAVTGGTRTVPGLFATRRELCETIPITCNFRAVEFSPKEPVCRIEVLSQIIDWQSSSTEVAANARLRRVLS